MSWRVFVMTRAIIVLVFSAIFLNAETLLSTTLQRPNIIFITVDTLRPDHLSCYGYPKKTSPNIDAFAQQAVIFKRAHAHSAETAPSMGSVFTGFFPHETRIKKNEFVLPADADTLAELLSRQGYRTSAIVGNPVLRTSSQFNQGFEAYNDHFTDLVANGRGYEKNADTLTDEAIRWLKKRDERPFFLWLHYMDPHGPYTPPPPYDRMFDDEEGKNPVVLKVNENPSGLEGIPSYQKLGERRDVPYYVSQYDGEIRFLDENLGRLFSTLKRLRLDKNAMIVFTADHGEEMGEADYFLCHGETLNYTAIQVPLMISFNGRKEIVETRAQHIDLLPTVLTAAGIAVSSNFRGRNLLAPKIEERTIFSELMAWRAVAIGQYYLVQNRVRGGETFIDLENDGFRMRDLSQTMQNTEIYKKAHSELNRLSTDNLLDLKEQAVTPSPEDIEALRSLGYTQ